MCIRATPQIDLQLSPYHVIFGRSMPINALGETGLAVKFGDTQESWFCHLCRELRRLHDAVKNRKEGIKLEQKTAYDLRHRVREPTWSVGDLVLLKHTRVTPYSNRVITNKPYKGPFKIAEIIQSDTRIGPAYRLERLDNDPGRPLRYLITPDRLKRYTADRGQLSERLPPLPDSSVAETNTDTDDI